MAKNTNEQANCQRVVLLCKGDTVLHGMRAGRHVSAGLKVLLPLIECCASFTPCNTTNITQVQARARVVTKRNGYIRVVEWSWSS